MSSIVTVSSSQADSDLSRKWGALLLCKCWQSRKGNTFIELSFLCSHQDYYDLYTINWGAERRHTARESVVKKVNIIKQRRSRTVAAYRHSAMISLVSSSFRRRSVINFISSRISSSLCFRFRARYWWRMWWKGSCGWSVFGCCWLSEHRLCPWAPCPAEWVGVFFFSAKSNSKRMSK